MPEQLAASFADAALACAAVESASLPDATENTADTADTADTDSAPASWARANEMLTAVEVVTQLSTQLDAVMVTATSHLTTETGKLLLADRSLTDPAELSQTDRNRWRSRTKSLARHEIEAAIGWGAGEVIDLVALANSPTVVTAPVRNALLRGEASWALARRYFRACSNLPHEDCAAIATALFGDDLQTAVTERITSDGEWTGQPWHHKEFNRALDREVARVKACDPEAEAKTRQAARDRADVRVHLDDDGSAEVMIGCLTLQGAAIADRIEHAARAVRKAGDPRTLSQLRSAVATALLLHGTVDFGDLSDDPDAITVEQSVQLSKILHGLPTADLNVIVPFSMLAGATAPTCSCHPPDASPDHSAFIPAQPDDTARPCGSSTQLPPPDQAGLHPMPGDIAEVIGRHSAFISTQDVRRLLLTPGSVLHRLVTDPTTGRCLERSTTAYRFTAAQREQIIAADRFCRAPGCLHPGSSAQIDHVQEYGTAGGDTREANGQLLHEPHHDLKTKKAWTAAINESREVTWTTLLGRIYRTKAHDYRQYTHLLRGALDANEDHEGTPMGDDDGLGNTAASDAHGDVEVRPDRSAVDLAVHTALSYRPAGAHLLAEDDWDESFRRFLGWGMISLSYGTAQGRRRYGPHPDRVAAERRRHAETAGLAPEIGSGTDVELGGGARQPDGNQPGAQQSGATHQSPDSRPAGSDRPFLKVDPALLEGALRLDDPALLEGPPEPPPDDYSRYARPVLWDPDDDDPPPF